MHRPTTPRRIGGFTMIEILVTLVVTAVGMLGLAGFVVRATTLSADSVQRARAAVLVNDMAARLNDNKAIAASFVQLDGGGPKAFGASVDSSCSSKTGAERQLCEWSNALAGANDGGSGAAFLGYRGCVTTNVDPNLYTVTVAWGSMTPGTPPADQCGAGVFGTETQGLRRVLRLQVRVATLAAA